MDELNTNNQVEATTENDVVKDSNDTVYKIICLLLALGIVLVFALKILPGMKKEKTKEFGSLEDIDFSNSTWLDEYAEKSAGIYEKYFMETTSFSYGQETGKINVIYGSNSSIEDLRELYKTNLNAEEYDRNDETAMHLKAATDDGDVTIVNYYSAVCSILGINEKLNDDIASNIHDQLEEAFPNEELAKIDALKSILSCDEYGCSVRYNYDGLSEYLYDDYPIYSKAYSCNVDIEKIDEKLNAIADKVTYDDGEDVYYYQIDGDVVGVYAFTNDAGEDLVTVLIQMVPDEE